MVITLYILFIKFISHVLQNIESLSGIVKSGCLEEEKLFQENDKTLHTYLLLIYNVFKHKTCKF